jgi:coenzyme Q-binding protein COQ10
MVKYSVKKKLNYSNKQMFDLISDVSKYPEFLPWCISTSIYNKSNDIFYSDMEIGFKFIKETFTSKVTLLELNKVCSEAVSGPFKKMNNIWEINHISDQECDIHLSIEFEFKSFILQNIIGKLFENATKKMITAFESRAYDLYK